MTEFQAGGMLAGASAGEPSTVPPAGSELRDARGSRRRREEESVAARVSARRREAGMAARSGCHAGLR